jgi:hypothetical protein
MGTELFHADGQTKGQTDTHNTDIIVASHSFGNATKKENLACFPEIFRHEYTPTVIFVLLDDRVPSKS